MTDNPYQPPQAELLDSDEIPMEYVGFWMRVLASIIDSILISLITLPLLMAVYGQEYWQSEALIQGVWDFIISWLLPAVAIILFWVYRSATPGKILIKAKIVDAETGERPTTGQFIGRYLGYFVAMLPFMLGIIWVAFDARKQGWHDKLAHTVVIKTH